MNELRKLLLEQAKEQFKMRMEKGMGEAPKPHALKKLAVILHVSTPLLTKRSGKHERKSNPAAHSNRSRSQR